MADDRIKVSGMTEATDTQMTDDAIIQVAVTEQSASTGFLTRKSTLARLANYILNKHNLVNLAGLTQTVKSAFQSVLDKINEIVEAIGDEPMGTTATTVTGAIAEHESDISELNSNINDLNSQLNGVAISYCAPNNSVKAASTSKSYCLIYGRRGGTGILAIAWQNNGTAGISVLAGTSTWISVSYDNGLVISSTDAYTYLNVIWN